MSRNRSPERRRPARIAQETVVRFSNSATVCLKVSRCRTQDARDAFAHDASVLRARPRGAPQLGSVVVRRRVSLGLRTAAGGVCRAGVVRAPEVAGLQRRSGSACRVTGCDRGRFLCNSYLSSLVFWRGSVPAPRPWWPTPVSWLSHPAAALQWRPPSGISQAPFAHCRRGRKARRLG